MIKLPFILLLLILPGCFLAQAELDKVRNMFTPLDESMVVKIWKGHFYENHPVELFLASRENEIKGYYRLISSGEEFSLEGEVTNAGISLSEYRDNEEIGLLYLSHAFTENETEPLKITWQSLSKDDAINFNVKKAKFSDYTTNSFQPEVKKYCHYENKKSTCITLELIDNQRVIFSHSNTGTKTTTERNTSAKNLTFTRIEHDGTAEYQEINNTLRKLKNGQFIYFDLQNALQFKRINYASSELIMDVEFPELKSKAFNSYIQDIISTRRKAIRREIKEIDDAHDHHPSLQHYQYKWQGWTEIDYLGTSMISGRIISILSRGAETEMEVIPFNYDLIDEKNVLIKQQFKSDFSMDSYLSKYIHAELPQLKLDEDVNPSVTEDDFKHLTFSDDYILISTDYDWTFGETVLRIPHVDMRSLVKRNSILKTLMKN